MNINELEPGPEMDRLIYEALGRPEELSSDGYFMGEVFIPDDSVIYWNCSPPNSRSTVKHFQPSTSLHDAMWAARQAGLISANAVDICKAILKLKGA